MSGITLSKEYGLNPSIETCFVCGQDLGLILFGTSYEENGKVAEAPRQMTAGNLCDNCKKVIKAGGTFVIEVEDDTDRDNPYRTGRVVGVVKEKLQLIIGDCKDVNYMERTAFEQIFGHCINGAEKL